MPTVLPREDGAVGLGGRLGAVSSPFVEREEGARMLVKRAEGGCVRRRRQVEVLGGGGGRRAAARLVVSVQMMRRQRGGRRRRNNQRGSLMHERSRPRERRRRNGRWPAASVDQMGRRPNAAGRIARAAYNLHNLSRPTLVKPTALASERVRRVRAALQHCDDRVALEAVEFGGMQPLMAMNVGCVIVEEEYRAAPRASPFCNRRPNARRGQKCARLTEVDAFGRRPLGEWRSAVERVEQLALQLADRVAVQNAQRHRRLAVAADDNLQNERRRVDRLAQQLLLGKCVARASARRVDWAGF